MMPGWLFSCIVQTQAEESDTLDGMEWTKAIINCSLFSLLTSSEVTNGVHERRNKVSLAKLRYKNIRADEQLFFQ
jgi:hypothetical protein